MKKLLVCLLAAISVCANARPFTRADVPQAVMNPDLNADLPEYDRGTGVATVKVHILDWVEKHRTGDNYLVVNKLDGSHEIIYFLPDKEGNATLELEMDSVKNTWLHTALGTIGGVTLKGGETVDAYLFPYDNTIEPLKEFKPQALTNGVYGVYSYIEAMPEYTQALKAQWTEGDKHIKPKMDSEDYTLMCIGYKHGVINYLAAHPELPRMVRQYIEWKRGAFVDRVIAKPAYTAEYTLAPGTELTFTELTPEQIARIRAVK